VPERAALPRTAGGAPPGCWCPRWLRSCAGPPPRRQRRRSIPGSCRPGGQYRQHCRRGRPWTPGSLN